MLSNECINAVIDFFRAFRVFRGSNSVFEINHNHFVFTAVRLLPLDHNSPYAAYTDYS
jgi:hypothetical protein